MLYYLHPITVEYFYWDLMLSRSTRVNFMPREKSSLPLHKILMNLSSDSSVVNSHSLDDIGVWDHICLSANTPVQFLTVMSMFFTTSLYEISFISWLLKI
jgi:hypothetical protein